MQVRSLGRVAVDRGLRVARLPLDAAAHMLPEDRGPRNSALLAIDRVDANVRAAAGGLLNDDVLRGDATRRFAAADERQRALELHAQAEAKKRDADAVLSEDLDRGVQLREAAEQDAEQRRQQVATAAAQQKQKVERAAEEQARAVDETLEVRLTTTAAKAKRERLEVLDKQTAALDKQADALTASDEAQRLAKAARTAKATRKGTA